MVTRASQTLCWLMGIFSILMSTMWLNAQQERVGCIIYSFDRPLQLYALLESMERYVTGLEYTYVVYRASTNFYFDAYEEVNAVFKNVTFIAQGDEPACDFKPLTMSILRDEASTHVIFAVDDIIVTLPIDARADAQLLDQTQAYGLFYRLGKNLNACYPLRCGQRIPPLSQVNEHVFAWRFSEAEHDWAYPHTVDMTLYRTADVIAGFDAIRFTSPNTLESMWASHTGHIMSRIGLCYDHSKIVNLPLNRVQDEFQNRHMNVLSPQDLLDMFEQGLKIDIDPLFNIDNPSAHMEYIPIFRARTVDINE